MVTKNRYCQQCYNNAVKYVFQINENENENFVRTTKFKAFHHWYFARYILQPINGAHTMLHKTVFFWCLLCCILQVSQLSEANKSN